MARTPAVTAAERGSATALDTLVGAGFTVVDVLSNPGRFARGAYRRGAGTTEAGAAGSAAAVDELSGLPGRLVSSSVRQLRLQAASRGRLAPVARGLLLAVHRPSKAVATLSTRLARDTELPTRRRRRAAASRTTPVAQVKRTTERASSRGRQAAGAAKGGRRSAVARSSRKG